MNSLADDITLPKQSSLIALAAVAKNLTLPKGRIKSARSGQRLSPFKGRGMEFDEARPYQAGDDIRSIDWKVTARTQKTHTKVFRQERERPVYVWVDNRRSMHFATKKCYKSVLAAQLASIFAWNALSHSDCVGGMVFSENNHAEFKPRLGRSSVLHLIHMLSVAEPEKDVEPDVKAFDHALKRLTQMVKPGSLIYIISDFAQCGQQQYSIFGQLAKHNDLALMHVYDDFEKQLPPDGEYQIQMLDKQVKISTQKKQARNQYQAEFRHKQQQLQDLSVKHNMRFLALSTSDDALQSIKQWMK